MAYFPSDNYLFAEGVILDRLKELFPSGVHVESLGDVRELVQGNAHFPCVCVGYLGDGPAIGASIPLKDSGIPSLGFGKVIRSVQEWVVTVGAKDASTPRTSAKAREAAGKIYLRVLQGLQGFEVATGYYLRRAPFSGAAAAYFDGGHVFLTAQFNLAFDVRGE